MPLLIGKLIWTTQATQSHAGLRQAIFGVIFAILVSPGSVLVLYFGLTGSSGNSVVTGGVLIAATAAVASLCFRRDVVLLPADYLFFALMVCIISSSVVNGWTSSPREYQLLVLSLAAYPACRFISRADMALGLPSFICTTGAIVLLGSIATMVALWQQWDGQHGKPFVFGFDAAATHFLGSLSFFVIAVVTSGRLTMRRTALVSALIFLPTAIFAASLVRFTFVALAGSLCSAIILSEAKQRKYIVALAVVMFVAMAAGLLARHDQTRLYADYAMEQSSGFVGSEKPPSCYLKINLRNSVAIRKALLQDALFLIPTSGWIGTGLDSFMKFSCIELTEVHNSILQAALEFGWLGGTLLFVMVVIAAGPIFPQARQDDVARFVLCSLAFVVLVSLAHGRVSRDALLFAFLGCAVSLRETAGARAPATSPVIA
jgi:hypothetical protein